jgi:hypothetical protein
MESYGFPMWSRAGREIEHSYATYGSPLAAMASLQPRLPVLHLYAQPDDAGFLAQQQVYAREHPRFRVRKVAARSHFRCLKSREKWPGPLVDSLGAVRARIYRVRRGNGRVNSATQQNKGMWRCRLQDSNRRTRSGTMLTAGKRDPDTNHQ